MNLKNSLNVFYVIDKNFIIPFTVSLTSLLENNKDLDISVYVIHDLNEISVFLKTIKFFDKNYSINLHLLKFNNEIIEKIPNNFPGSKYISRATYFKLFFGELIPKNIDSGFYLDCDTIVTNSLLEISNLDFSSNLKGEEFSFLAVRDISEFDEIERINKLGIKLKSYFNAGVMLINLNKWRFDNVSNDLVNVLIKYQNHLEWLDQDVLNIHFANNYGNLNPKYNKFSSQKHPVMPTIIHFSGSSKPWQFTDISPYKYQFRKYLKLTPFQNHKIEKLTIKKVKEKYAKLLKSYL